MLVAVKIKSSTQLYKVYSKVENNKMLSLAQRSNELKTVTPSTNWSTSLLKEKRQLHSILTKDIAHKIKGTDNRLNEMGWSGIKMALHKIKWEAKAMTMDEVELRWHYMR